MLQQIETGIIAAINNALGKSVREVKAHPGHWGAVTVKHMIANAPSVYVGFTAGSYKDFSGDKLLGKWHVYLVGHALNGQRSVGIYQMLQQLLPHLHGLDLEQADALRFQQVKNLFSFAEGKHGICCYEMVFEIPMNWPDMQDPSSFNDWLSYHAEHYSPENPEQLMAEATVNFKEKENA